MIKPIKIFIFGSCVSRDPFEISDKRDFEVVAYYARCSLASLGSEPHCDDEILSLIKSKWQRSMVRADMEKTIFVDLKKKEFDYILCDFIDERFNLTSLGDSIHTLSAEYKKALYRTNKYRVINSYSEEKKSLWLKGLKKLADFLVINNLDEKILINKCYWTRSGDELGKLFDRYPAGSIDRANEQLDWMYEKVKEFLPKAVFINYSENELVIDVNHKWGLDPFHYIRGFSERQIKSIFDIALKKKKFEVNHKVGNLEIGFPIRWNLNPFHNKSWMHHFMSLRWLNDDYTDLLKTSILLSFYKFHCEKKIKNPYFNQLAGDHTAAIRLSVLNGILKKAKFKDNKALYAIATRIIREDLKNLQSTAMYRVGHNHALMVDISILELIKDQPQFNLNIDLDLIVSRSEKTFNLMWHPSGLTKEHSVSYQEYNLQLALIYFDKLNDLNIKPLFANLRDVILSESKKFLGYALKKSGEYFPLGDSFRTPNLKILQEAYGNKKNVFDLLHPFSREEGCYKNDNFFIFRSKVCGVDIHFATTCCWDSINHKQNDELSFCLEVDGITIFDELGYTEFLPWEKILDLKSEENHSTIQIEGEKWLPSMDGNGKSRIVKADFDEFGFDIEMVSERVKGYIFNRRILFKNKIFEVYDKIETVCLNSFAANRRFIFSKDIEIIKNEVDKFNIFSAGKKISELYFKEGMTLDCSTEIVKSNLYVCSDRKLFSDTFVIKESVNFKEGLFHQFRTIRIEF